MTNLIHQENSLGRMNGWMNGHWMGVPKNDKMKTS
jgi:hypothetical protein